MIAQIKTLANAKEIEKAQNEYQEVAEKNKLIDYHNQGIAIESQRKEYIEFPSIPEKVFGASDVHLKDDKIDLAFVNSSGEISIKYGNDNFNLIYSKEIWDKIIKAIVLNTKY